MDTPRPLVPLPTAGLHQRAGDLDRSAVCDQLSTHFAAGRLRSDELDARLTAAVNADTLLDLRRLVSDLPLAPTPTPFSSQPAPAPRASWRTLDVLALLAVIACSCFAVLAILALGMTNEGWLLLAGIGGGGVAAVGGASLAHLLHQPWRRSAPEGTGPDGGQRPRIA
jgi:hypothetical protein